MFVLDASVTMSWVLPGEQTEYTEAILDRLDKEGALVPHIWPLEIANVLLSTERRGRITEREAADFLRMLHELPLSVDESPALDLLERSHRVGGRHALSAYDAAYLDLAIRSGLSLASVDQRLLEAARAAGVSIIK